MALKLKIGGSLTPDKLDLELHGVQSFMGYKCPEGVYVYKVHAHHVLSG